MPCRAVYVAIPVCVAGVILITQPAFLGQDTQQRSKLGILLAVGQVWSMASKWIVTFSTHIHHTIAGRLPSKGNLQEPMLIVPECMNWFPCWCSRSAQHIAVNMKTDIAGSVSVVSAGLCISLV